ncbi:polyprenyl synthetase family protein [Candidatus Pacearchaeota archaeon]|nr:polyprenyl synthetase family protein [Candidatus Pacearchaeota archaeon]
MKEYKEKVNFALKRFLEKKLDDGKYSPEIKKLIENILEYSLRGGKRIRPLLIIFAYKCFKDNNEQAVIDASICIELMQAYLLIHDDIIDNADLRRGKPAMHKIYSSGDFGKSMAILAGNLCSHYMYDSILESDFSDKEKIEAIKYLGWIAERENYGQALDIIPGFENLNEEDVMKIYELKTATYTVQGPLYLGACLASAPSAEIEKLQEYGKNIGIAFQIQDDIIGIFGNIEETGKPNDSDIKEGKKTLLIVKALEFANSEDKKFLLENYGKKNISENDIKKIREIIEKLSLDYCRKKMSEMIEKGKNSLPSDLRDEGKNCLIEMADYISSLA